MQIGIFPPSPLPPFHFPMSSLKSLLCAENACCRSCKKIILLAWCHEARSSAVRAEQAPMPLSLQLCHTSDCQRPRYQRCSRRRSAQRVPSLTPASRRRLRRPPESTEQRAGRSGRRRLLAALARREGPRCAGTVWGYGTGGTGEMFSLTESCTARS